MEDRRALWEDLKNHQYSPMIRNKPWIVMGDFNETLEVEEHSDHATSPMVSHGMREFQEMVRYCSMIDMSFQGPKFTWTNKRETYKKSDRTLVNSAWVQTLPQSHIEYKFKAYKSPNHISTRCVFEAGGCSDHLRCRIQIRANVLKPKRPFKFINVVAESHDFLPLVEKFWADTPEIYSSTSAIFRLSKNVQDLNPQLRALSKAQVGDIIKRTREALEKLCKSQERTLLYPSQENLAEENRVYGRWSVLSAIEEKVLSQKAKLYWLQVGDGNNKHYHNVAKGLEVRNAIREIKRKDGFVAST